MYKLIQTNNKQFPHGMVLKQVADAWTAILSAEEWAEYKAWKNMGNEPEVVNV